MILDLHEEIAKLAYEIFEREGRVHGRDLDHWLEAERIVYSRYEAQWLSEKSQEESPKEKKKAKAKTTSTKAKTNNTEKTKKETVKKPVKGKKTSQ